MRRLEVRCFVQMVATDFRDFFAKINVFEQLVRYGFAITKNVKFTNFSGQAVNVV